jgi:hypothetical protein
MAIALWDGAGGFLEVDCGSQVWWDVGWLVFGIRPGSLWGESLEVYKAGVGSLISFSFFQSGKWREGAVLV